MPDGKPAIWDPEKLAAVSEVYNTIQFATPLVEMPIDAVTKNEAEEYRRFRLEYLGLWRQYFDPIGMRVALKDGQVKLDTYILPLIENSAYNNLRAVTGKGTVKLDPSSISSKTLFQYMMHLTTDSNERGGWFGLGGFGGPRGGAWASSVSPRCSLGPSIRSASGSWSASMIARTTRSSSSWRRKRTTASRPISRRSPASSGPCQSPSLSTSRILLR